jgi:apolipoprotein D and lipocalin family protein
MRKFGFPVICIAVGLAATLTLGCASAPSTKDIPAVTAFDERVFEGLWYELARIPISIARDWVGTSDTYIRNANGTWTVLYEGYKGGFDGKKGLMKQQLKAKKDAPAGELLASPFPLIWLPYRLVYWNEAAETMLVTSGTMDFLWLMAKDPVPAPEVYQDLVDQAAKLGFDTARIERVPQRK